MIRTGGNRQSGSGYCSYVAGGADGIVTYLMTPSTPGFMCIDLNLPKKNGYTVSLNGQKLYSETYSLPQCLAVANVQPGDVVQIDLKCKAGESGNITISGAVLDDGVFRNAYDVLSASTLELTSFSAASVEGVIDCNRDGLLYTSIPQDGHWVVYVDGEKTESTLVGGAMVAVSLPEGEHIVEFRYKNPSFTWGIVISLTGAVIFAALCFLKYHYPKIKKRKEVA